jgi:hypothetical protein
VKDDTVIKERIRLLLSAEGLVMGQGYGPRCPHLSIGPGFYRDGRGLEE